MSSVSKKFQSLPGIHVPTAVSVVCPSSQFFSACAFQPEFFHTLASRMVVALLSPGKQPQKAHFVVPPIPQISQRKIVNLIG